MTLPFTQVCLGYGAHLCLFYGLSVKQQRDREHTYKKTTYRSFDKLFFSCDPSRIPTCNPHIRSVVLYSVELTDPPFVLNFRLSEQKRYRLS